MKVWQYTDFYKTYFYGEKHDTTNKKNACNIGLPQAATFFLQKKFNDHLHLFI